MPKRKADAEPPKHRRDAPPPPVTYIVSCLYVEGKAAVARRLLKELASAVVIASDLRVGQQAVPKKAAASEFEVMAYATEVPELPPQALHQNAVVLAHDLARPSRRPLRWVVGSALQLRRP